MESESEIMAVNYSVTAYLVSLSVKFQQVEFDDFNANADKLQAEITG